MAIAKRVGEEFPSAPFVPADGTTFTVHVEFRLPSERMFIQAGHPPPPDLDNLLKPVLDTLFTSDNVGPPTGALVQANDTFVTEVGARKVMRDSSGDYGASISVEWSE